MKWQLIHLHVYKDRVMCFNKKLLVVTTGCVLVMWGQLRTGVWPLLRASCDAVADVTVVSVA